MCISALILLLNETHFLNTSKFSFGMFSTFSLYELDNVVIVNPLEKNILKATTRRTTMTCTYQLWITTGYECANQCLKYLPRPRKIIMFFGSSDQYKSYMVLHNCKKGLKLAMIYLMPFITLVSRFLQIFVKMSYS